MEEAVRAGHELLNSRSEPILAFGPFKLLPLRKALFKSDYPHVIGNRALELLTLLVCRAGKLVSKEELFAHAWPNMHVEEINLRVHIAALRKVLGDGQDGMRYIMTLPGRGYCFTAPVMSINAVGTPHPGDSTSPKTSSLPTRLSSMIGRDDVVFALKVQLEKCRFVTIIGPGGIGKTTVALATARSLIDRHEHGVHFVDLAPLVDGEMVTTALASVFGLSIASDDPLPRLIAALQGKRMLLLFDNCEHVIGAVASVAEAVLRASDDIHVLATSREALRAEGEWTYRLAPMEVPESNAGVGAARALEFPAVQLFIERASANCGTFNICDDNAPEIVDLCRRLDGLPLAIELAAARVKLSGLRQLAAQLDDRLLLFSEGRRTALPRHQTLHATLDWSYSLLTAEEQSILRAISIFKGAFGVECAIAVSSITGLGSGKIMAGIESLSEKSLLRIDAGIGQPKCRLLDTTRAYAFGKLRDEGELAALSRAHAERLVQLFAEAEADWDEMNGSEWVERYGPMMGDLRAALHWSLSANGNTKIAVALTAAAIPLWMHLSLTRECSESVARVIAKAGDVPSDATEDVYRRMKLLNALGLSLIYTKGPGPKIEDALREAGTLAEDLGDVDYQLRSLWGIFVAAFNEGNYPEALKRAKLFRSVAKHSSNPHDLKAGDRLLGFALHMLGHQSKARAYIEGMLESYVVPTRRSDFVRFQYDQRVAARVPLSCILWLQGYAEQAMDNATCAVEEAQSINHAISVGYALSTAACPTAFLVGDLDAAERFVAMLADHSAAYGLGPWSAVGRYFKGVLQSRSGQLHSGLDGIAAALNELRATGFVLRYTSYLAEFAELLGKAGRVDDGLIVVEEALSRCRRDGEGWCFADLLRVKGDLLLCQGLPGAMKASERLFQKSLVFSQKHATPAWTLRTATSLAKLRISQNRVAEGQTLLAATYSNFSEGFASVDLVRARTVLNGVNGRDRVTSDASLGQGESGWYI